MTDCVFCKIISKDIPAQILYDDENILAFKDLNPVAPVHFLVVPKIHITDTDEINDKNKHLIAEIFKTIPLICRNLGISRGYRIVNNCGERAGQTVTHIHFHILGERDFKWPPG